MTFIHHFPKRLAAAALFALAVAAGACGCSQADSGSATRTESAHQTFAEISNDASYSEEAEAEPEDGAEPDEAFLAELIGEEQTAKLLEKAQSDPRCRWIAAHPEAIAFEGDTVQAKLLSLAANDDEAVDFVRDFAERYPADDATGDAASAIEHDTRTPHLYQWDQRWGYTIYSSTAFGLTGCGPTALAMAYQGATGKSDRSPYDIGLLAQEMGYMAQYEGTSSAFLVDASPALGMSCEVLSIDEASVTDALQRGCVLIANVGHGYFSRFDGHYLVLTDCDDAGQLTINDPYSAVHSQQTWDIQFILGQTKGLYAFSAA